MGVCLAAADFNQLNAADRAALDGADFIVNSMLRSACSDILHELAMARIFEKEYSTILEFMHAIGASTLINKASLAFRAGSIGAGDPFDRPGRAGVAARGGRRAVPAVAAAPGPVALGPLRRVSWGDMLQIARQVHPEFPGLFLAQL